MLWIRHGRVGKLTLTALQPQKPKMRHNTLDDSDNDAMDVD